LHEPFAIRNVRIVDDGAQTQPVTVTVHNGRVTHIGVDLVTDSGLRVWDAEGLWLSGGFIDLQLNGAYGYDFTSDPTAIADVARTLPRHGITRFLPTIITSSREARSAAMTAVHELVNAPGSARVHGLHFEGPFINPQASGTHPQAMLSLPAIDEAMHWLSSGVVSMVTLAPELDGSDQVIRILRAGGVVVSIGHTAATYEEARVAIDGGAVAATHLFNAMPGVSARSPGAAVAVLQDTRVSLGMILDGHHVHESMVRLAWSLASDRLALVSDATAAAGRPDGDYMLGSIAVMVSNGAVHNKQGGLAGSATMIDQAIRNLMSITRCSLSAAIKTVTAVPAALLGLPPVAVKVGSVADLVLLDGDAQVVQTWVDGVAISLRSGEE
jgi:N-acetylglucosamine-6-phosphate deacetylase